MSRAIRNSDEISIMENIALVTMKTANSLEQIMKMKFATFLALVKEIRMSQLMQNPEWREAYLNWEVKEAYKNGTIEKQTQPDLEGLMAFQSGL